MMLRTMGCLALAGLLQLGCAASPAPVAATVKAGSMARFIAHNGFLYALSGSELIVYDTGPTGSPTMVTRMQAAPGAETLFPYDKLLFVGTRQGMFVFSIEQPTQPKLIGEAQHAVSCDPVVVEEDIAYVTLRSGTACNRGVNVLLVFDVSDPTQPKELARQPMSSPHGLGVDGDMLFVADATDGILVLDVSDPQEPRLIAKAPTIHGYDVIANAGRLLISADDGLYQFQYGPDGTVSPQPLSRIPIGEAAQPPPTKMASDPAQPSQ